MKDNDLVKVKTVMFNSRLYRAQHGSEEYIEDVAYAEAILNKRHIVRTSEKRTEIIEKIKCSEPKIRYVPVLTWFDIGETTYRKMRSVLDTLETVDEISYYRLYFNNGDTVQVEAESFEENVLGPKEEDK